MFLGNIFANCVSYLLMTDHKI